MFDDDFLGKKKKRKERSGTCNSTVPLLPVQVQQSSSFTTAAAAQLWVRAQPQQNDDDDNDIRRRLEGDDDDDDDDSIGGARQKKAKVVVDKKSSSSSSLSPTTNALQQEEATTSLQQQQQQQQQRRQPGSKNIVHFLMKRQQQQQQLLPYNGPLTPRTSTKPQLLVNMPWKIASWIAFQSPLATSTTSAATATVQALAFDSMGVLLAVAYETGLIRIFDWDTVQAADQQGRRQQQRRSHAATAAAAAAVLVEPILEFVATPSSSSFDHHHHRWQQWRRGGGGNTIACLQWHGDELAVGMRRTGAIHLYDVSTTNTNTTTTVDEGMMMMINNNHHRAIHPPCRKLTTGIDCPTELSLLFLGSDRHEYDDDGIDVDSYCDPPHSHALVAANQQISCWELRSSNSSSNNNNNSHTPKRKWTLNWSSAGGGYVTSMAVVTNDVVVLGSSQGTLALLNWKLLQRPAFSTAPIPTILREWSTTTTTTAVPGIIIPSPGIQNLHVDIGTGGMRQAGSSTRTITPNNFDQAQGLIHLDWVTRCGWHLTTRVDIQAAAAAAAAGKQQHQQRHYATPPQVQYRTARVIYKQALTNKEVKNPPAVTWSMPAHNAKVKTAVADGSLLWEHVPQVTQFLQDDNKYVLGSGSSHFVRSNDKPTLLWRDIGRRRQQQQQQSSSSSSSSRNSGEDDGLSRIPLSKRRGHPTALAIHPNREWIVVGTKAHDIYAINARNKA